jgi:mannan endo-1,4-beta-mannosidase
MKTTSLIKCIILIPIILLSCKGNGVRVTQSNNFIDIDISIDTESGRKHISPLIYGINGIHSESLTTTAMRLGGNRTTGYNWENNLSNAGEDWHNFNDDYLVPKGKDGSIPAITITDFVENAKKANAYTLITLPMAG